MTTQSRPSASAERGFALIMVLLLMAVMTGLASGFALHGRVEAAMASNEVAYAGARAAAEAGMNRAIEAITHNTDTDFLAGPDGLVDAANPSAAVNADNGSVASLLTGASPYALGASGQYTYSIEILDDDDPSLYATALTAGQLADMGNEDGNAYTDTNDRLILRATGFGPNNTEVRISRILESAQNITTTPATSLNPAILVNGDLDVSGNIHLEGAEGSVHVNGDLAITGNAADVSGDATATGDFTSNPNWHADGTQGSGYPTVNVPDIHASDYAAHADYILRTDGTITNGNGSSCGGGCPTGWTHSGSTWSVTGNTVSAGTFYVQGEVSISGSPGKKGGEIAFSVIATGSISITGTPKFKPENDAKIQFVTDGDLLVAGNVDLDDPTAVEGQILVREQMHISGNPEFQGRILVQNSTDDADQSGVVTSNAISGNPTITYNGTLGALEVPGTSTTAYTNNVKGWMEQ